MLHKHDKDTKDIFFPLATELWWECYENLISYHTNLPPLTVAQ